jgi:hypothetical protein
VAARPLAISRSRQNSTRNNRLQQVTNAFDAGGSVGVLRHAFGNLATPSGTGAGGVLSFHGLSLVDQADWLH